MMNENKKRCPKCSGSFVYVRLKTKEIVCRSCGAVSKIEVKEPEKIKPMADDCVVA